MIRPRLHNPADLASRDTRCRRVEPIPLQVRRIDQETPAGPCTDFVMIWNVEDGRACNLCPVAECNFSGQHAKGGIGSCVVRRKAGETFDLD